MGMVARNSSADINVIGLIGERVERLGIPAEGLKEEGLKICCSSSYFRSASPN